jgi:hypothetical protein
MPDSEQINEKKPSSEGFFNVQTKQTVWLRGPDLNQRPLGYEPNELPDCSTPRHV